MKKIDPLLGLQDIIEIFNCTPNTIFRWLREARAGQTDFPLPVRLPGRKLGWTKDSVETYLSRGSPPVEHLKFETESQRKKRNADALDILKKEFGLKVKPR